MTKSPITNKGLLIACRDSLFSAFLWKGTEEGYDYWSEVFNKLNKLCYDATELTEKESVSITENTIDTADLELGIDVKVIQKVYRAIEQSQPERFRMNIFIDDRDDSICNTAACIAGWTALTLHKTHKAWADVPWRKNPKNNTFHLTHLKYFVEREAATALGLSERGQEKLFFMKYSQCTSVLLSYGIYTVIGDNGEVWSVEDSDPLSYFDYLPALFRKQCALHVLNILGETKIVDWAEAMRRAAHDCGWNMVRPERKLNEKETNT